MSATRFSRANPCVSVPVTLRTSGLIGELSGAQLKVYLALITRIDGSHECWPSYQTIAEDTKLHRSTVVEAVNDLVRIGLVAKEHRASESGDHTSNVYTVMYPVVESDQMVNPTSPGSRPQATTPSRPQATTPSRPQATTNIRNNQLEHVPTEDLPTSSDSAAAQSPDEPDVEKNNPYQMVVEIYRQAGRPEPPRSEVLPLLRGVKSAVGSPGWSVGRIAAAWKNAINSGGNPAIWSLAYTIRHLTEAESLVPRPAATGPRSTQPAAHLRSDRAWAEEVAREWREGSLT